MIDLDRLRSDGTPSGTTISPAEERAIAGEELWWPPGGSAGVVVTEQTALQSSALLATINVIASDVAVLPLNVHQRMPDGTCREAVEHPVRELLCRSPDGESCPVRWKQSLMAHALIYGSGYGEIQRRGNGSPYGLHLLDASSTQAKRDSEKRLFYQLADRRTIPAEDVLHIAGLGYDGISGYNMIRLLRQAIGLSIAGETFAADFFSNGSESGGTIEIPGRLKDNDSVLRLTNRWEGRHQGAGRRHKVAVLEEGAKYSPTGTDPEKSQLIETRRFQVTDLTRPYRLPPNKYGDFSEAHLSNVEAANLDYLMTALMIWLTVIEQEFSLKLFSRKEWAAGYYVEHDVSKLLRGDQTSRYNSYAVGIRDGWLSRNEVRRRENLNPIPADKGGDLYTVQMQIVPLGTPPPAEKPAPDPKPAPEPATSKTPVKTPAKEERSETRMNPHHDSEGQFSAGSGASRRGADGHAEEVKARIADRRHAAKPPASDPHRELRISHKAERKEHAHDISVARKDLAKEHAKESKKLSERDQPRKHKALDREQAGEAKKLDSRHEREMARSTRPDRTAERHSQEKEDLAQEHKEARHDLAEEHKGQRDDLGAEHKEAKSDFRRSQLDEIDYQRHNHRAEALEVKRAALEDRRDSR